MCRSGNHSSTELFCETLSAVKNYSSFKELATVTYADGFIGSSSLVCSIEFDKDGDFFAVGGATKKVKVLIRNICRGKER